jgi:G protein beta subunit-like protein
VLARVPTLLTFSPMLQQVNCLQITPDKQYIAAAGNAHVRLYDIESSATTPVSDPRARVSAMS